MYNCVNLSSTVSHKVFKITKWQIYDIMWLGQ